MKDIPISNLQKEFILKTIKINHRIDGRKNDEFRNVDIQFGEEWGCVLVSLGETKVLCQVSCDLQEPRAYRPNEGIMFINVDVGPMAAPNFEIGRNSELIVQINRTLERTFRDSNCVDLESLCVVVEEKVWVLNVEINVLNHEGNLIDCCSMAALAGLGHFRRPDVSIIDNEVHIHTPAEKDPLPLVLHHHPICVTYCTFEDGKVAVSDPNWLEEKVASSSLIFGLNSYRELCCLNLGGSTLTSADLVIKCAHRAAKHAQNVVEQIKQALQRDSEDRENGIKRNFTQILIQSEKANEERDLFRKLNSIVLKSEGNDSNDESGPKVFDTSNTGKKSKKKKEKKNKNDTTAAAAGGKEEKNLISWIPEEDIKVLGVDLEEKSVTEQIEESIRLKNKLNEPSLTTKDTGNESTNDEDDYSDEEEDVVML